MEDGGNSSVPAAFDPEKPAFVVERQFSAHVPLHINPGVPHLGLGFTARLQDLVHPGAVFTASRINQMSATSHGPIRSHRRKRDKNECQPGRKLYGKPKHAEYESLSEMTEIHGSL
jgi:hypothetical protein